jgi:hypothetical protein
MYRVGFARPFPASCDVRHLFVLQRYPRPQHVRAGDAGRAFACVRSGARATLGDLPALPALESVAAGRTVGGDCAVPAGVFARRHYVRRPIRSVWCATRDGMQLVRIGQPSRSEMATWRYARVFQQRRRHAYIAAAAISVVGMGVIGVNQWSPALYSAIPAIGSLPALTNVWHLYREFVRPVARVPDASGAETVLRGQDVTNVFLAPDADGWMLRVARRHGRPYAARRRRDQHAGSPPGVLKSRGRARRRRDGCRRTTQHRGLGRRVSARGRRAQCGDGALTRSIGNPAPWSRALRSRWALHEETERRADDGDLAALHDAWRDAESLAAIADQLTLPAWMSERMRGLRSEEGTERE